MIAFAKDVGVAPQTLLWILNDGNSASKQAISASSSAKAKAGFGESLGRMVAYANRGQSGDSIWSSDAVIEALNLDAKDPSIQQGLNRYHSLATAADIFLTHEDRTLERIVRGGENRPANTPIAGVLVWPPYCLSSDETELNQSFAGGLVRRLLGCLNPLGWNQPQLKSMSFADVITPSALRDGEIDILMSLYDTSARRLAGFDFIHIPGIGAPMGGLKFGIDAGAIAWADVLDPYNSAVKDIEVYVLRNDAGDQLITGSCGYAAGKVTRLPEDESSDPTPENIALALSSLLLARERGDALRNQPFVFVADASLVHAVKLKIDENLINLGKKPAEADNLMKDIKADTDTPVYAIGLAVAANSPRWRKIISDALIDEIFGNMIGVTARSYAKLLASPSTIKLTSLTPELPEHVATDFANRVLKVLNEMAADPKNIIIKANIEERVEDLKKANANLVFL